MPARERGGRRAQARVPDARGAARRWRCTGRSARASNALGFKVYRRGTPVVLSDSLPMLEHMGVRVLGEQNHRIDARGGGIGVAARLRAPGAGAPTSSMPRRWRALFEDAFARVFRGDVENDDFNRLVLRAGLAADEIVVLRAYAKYLKQIGFALSQASIEATLAAHPRIARMLVALFKLRFDPRSARRAAASERR